MLHLGQEEKKKTKKRKHKMFHIYQSRKLKHLKCCTYKTGKKRESILKCRIYNISQKMLHVFQKSADDLVHSVKSSHIKKKQKKNK